MPIVVTHHANQRYRERVERCSKRDAAERVKHAMEISQPVTHEQMRWMLRHRCWNRSSRCRWCPIENLLLVYVEDSEMIVVLTVFRVPPDAECREDFKSRRRAFKLARRERMRWASEDTTIAFIKREQF